MKAKHHEAICYFSLFRLHTKKITRKMYKKMRVNSDIVNREVRNLGYIKVHYLLQLLGCTMVVILEGTL